MNNSANNAYKVRNSRLLTASEEIRLARQINAARGAKAMLEREDERILDPAERMRLQQTVEDGVLARKRIIDANQRLVNFIARDYQGRGLDFDDLVQEGNIGLMRAVDKFDTSRGCRFSTYGTYWIKQAIGRAIATQSRTIRIPEQVSGNLVKMNREESSLSQELGRKPTEAELETALGWKEGRVNEIKRLTAAPSSLDEDVRDEKGRRKGVLSEFVEDRCCEAPEGALEHGRLREEMQVLIERLPEQEQLVIRLVFGFADGTPHTVQEVSSALAMAPERVKQLQVMATSRIRPSVKRLALSWGA